MPHARTHTLRVNADLAPSLDRLFTHLFLLLPHHVTGHCRSLHRAAFNECDYFTNTVLLLPVSGLATVSMISCGHSRPYINHLRSDQHGQMHWPVLNWYH